jgi:hypothetical protein
LALTVRAGESGYFPTCEGKEQTMATDALWRIAIRLLHPKSKPTGVCLELMSNADLDHWLEDHDLA